MENFGDVNKNVEKIAKLSNYTDVCRRVPASRRRAAGIPVFSMGGDSFFRILSIGAKPAYGFRLICPVAPVPIGCLGRAANRQPSEFLAAQRAVFHQRLIDDVLQTLDAAGAFFNKRHVLSSRGTVVVF
jgi:hypothetical protein